VIFGPNDHTSLMAFIEAGAAGSYGTVSEPAPGIEKFPGPQDYFYQAADSISPSPTTRVSQTPMRV